MSRELYSAMFAKLADGGLAPIPYDTSQPTPMGSYGVQTGVPLADQPLPEHPVMPVLKFLGATAGGAAVGYGGAAALDWLHRKRLGMGVPAPAIHRVLPYVGAVGAGAGSILGMLQQDAMGRMMYNGQRRREILEARGIREAGKRAGTPA